MANKELPASQNAQKKAAALEVYPGTEMMPDTKPD